MCRTGKDGRRRAGNAARRVRLLMIVSAAVSGAPKVTLAEEDIQALFERAERESRVGRARKTKPVDVRPAQPGEVVVTYILGQGVETKSPPAGDGDMVVRNRCAETGNEEILVTKEKFGDRYAFSEPPRNDGWREARPRGKDMDFFVVPQGEAPFTFKAPWGEPMKAEPGDVIVRDPTDRKDTYRIARAAFTCTYDVSEQPAAR